MNTIQGDVLNDGTQTKNDRNPKERERDREEGVGNDDCQAGVGVE